MRNMTTNAHYGDLVVYEQEGRFGVGVVINLSTWSTGKQRHVVVSAPIPSAVDCETGEIRYGWGTGHQRMNNCWNVLEGNYIILERGFYTDEDIY